MAARGGDTLLAHAFLFALEGWFGGQRVSVGGIASVGVAPEARGRGLGSQLVAHCHDVARARDHALTLLYPFRQGFYARLGYAATSPYRRLRLSPAAIPWRAQGRVRAASGADGEALRACWEATGVRRTGTLARAERVWTARQLDQRLTWLVVEGEKGVEGYVAWAVDQPEPHARTTLVVREMAALSDAAMRSLWGVVAAQRDQVSEIQADVSADDPIDRALVDADRARFGDASVEHALGELAAGPMLHVLGLARALEARGWVQQGALVIDTGDHRLQLTVREGHAAVASTKAEPDIRIDGPSLAAIAFGGLRASDASRLGWLAVRDEVTVARADALFALPPFFSPDPF